MRNVIWIGFHKSGHTAIYIADAITEHCYGSISLYSPYFVVMTLAVSISHLQTAMGPSLVPQTL